MSSNSQPTPEYRLEDILHSEGGVLTLGSTRAVVLTEPAYVFLMNILREHAPHVIKYAFYDMGYRVGQQLTGALPDRGKDPAEAFRYLVESYRQTGYGNLEVVHFDLSLPEATLAGTDLFEAKVATLSGVYRSPRCVDHYTRGLFAGSVSNLLGREVVCEEISCQFRGDPRCEFVILPFRKQGD